MSFKKSLALGACVLSLFGGIGAAKATTAKAAVAIIAACMGPKNQIMSNAKAIYRKQGYNPNNVDWNRAISVAEKLDRQEGLGCFK